MNSSKRDVGIFKHFWKLICSICLVDNGQGSQGNRKDIIEATKKILSKDITAIHLSNIMRSWQHKLHEISFKKLKIQVIQQKRFDFVVCCLLKEH